MDRREPHSAGERVRVLALEVGFDLVGIARPDPSTHHAFFREWVERGLQGEMGYLGRPDAIARREDLSRTMESVRSVVVVGHEYFGEDVEGVPDDPSVGVVARYARGRDYHKVVKSRLLDLLARIQRDVDPRVTGRAYVDTGPILERELAQRAGLGWFGRNTMLIHPRRGSWFFLGCLLLDLDLEPDEPIAADHCGTCTRCLGACPTGALLGRNEDGAPVMDARRCISYLTIEHRGPIPLELRPLIGNRVYGCDICQEVCPFNERFAAPTDEPGYAARGPGELPTGVEAPPGERELESAGTESAGTEPTVPGDGGGDVSAETGGAPSAATPADVSAETPGGGNPPHPGTHAPSLVELMRMTREDWDDFSRGSAIRRAGYAGFKRNVAVAMGNWLAALERDPPEEAVAVLREALEDGEELVREHAVWALEEARIGREHSPGRS